jgi:hypothetical protein
MCVREKERERQTDREKERGRERLRERATMKERESEGEKERKKERAKEIASMRCMSIDIGVSKSARTYMCVKEYVCVGVRTSIRTFSNNCAYSCLKTHAHNTK